MKITIIGCGKMGGGIARRLATEHDLALFDHHEETAKALADEIHATASSSPSEAIAHGDVIFLCVKPKDLVPAAFLFQNERCEGKLLVSILAGTSTETLQKLFPKSTVLRMMPNLAVLHGKGVIGIAESPHLTDELKTITHDALKNLGHIHVLPENQLDALTALTGSGPAYLFVIFEAIVDAGIAMGFPAQVAKTLALELFEGSLSLLKETEKHPGELKWDVCSPAGTTIEGMQVLEEHAVRAAIQQTFLAAFHKARELGSS